MGDMGEKDIKKESRRTDTWREGTERGRGRKGEERG